MRVIKFIGAAVGAIVVFALAALLVVLWRAGRQPTRPSGLSANAIHFEPFGVPFTLHQRGYRLDCWLDENTGVDRCRLTDVKGKALFEDVFLPCDGQSPVPERDLVFARGTGYTWTGSSEKNIHVPVIYLVNGQILLPRSIYEEARKKTIDCPQDRSHGS